jgi:hypothetical protein
MNKQRKTSHILNVFQYDADGHVVLPASLALGIAPTGEDNSGKVPTTAWVRSIVGGAVTAYAPTSRTITINGTSYDLSSNRAWSIDTGVMTASAGLGISVSVVNQNLNIVNTGILTASSGAGISLSVVNQNLNVVNTGILTASAGLGISLSVVNQNLNVINTGILTASAGSGISLSVVDQNLNVINTGVLTASAGAGISLSIVGGNLNVVNTITNNNQLTNGAGYITSSALTGYATETYVGTAISNLVDAAPGTLDTLNELAAALGDDPNFATTVATSIGTKQAQLNGTGFVKVSGTTVSYDNSTYLTTSSAASTYVSLSGSYANPAWITSLGWGKITSTPTTISGYGITNAYTDAQIQNFFNGANAITGYNKSNWDTAYGWGNHASGGYLTGITSTQVTNALGYTPYNSTNPSGYITSSGSISGNAATATTATNFNNGYAYSSGSTVYVDTLESINTNDWLELVYYGGVGVRIGTGVNGSKALYAGSLYDAGNRVYSAGNPQVNISGNAATATNVAWTGVTGRPTALSSFTNDLGNYGGWITGYTETDTLASVTSRGSSTTGAINVNGDLGVGNGTTSISQAIRLGGGNAAGGRLYFQYAGDSSYIDSYGGHGGGERYRDLQIVARNLNLTSSGGNVNINGSLALHVGNYASYALPLSGGTLSGVLYFTDTTNGIYKSGARLTIRSESVDNVANFADYGMYLPRLGQQAGLYVESPIEARGGLRIGSGASSGTINVGADTAVVGSRLVQRDANGYIYANHINFSTSETENSTVNSFITSNGDGWSRKASLQHVRNQLGNYGGWITGLSFDGLSSKTGGTGTYQTSGDFRAPIFYDSNDTTYYGDFAGTSLFNVVRMGTNANQTFAQLNISQGVGGATTYRDIDLKGSWSGGEGHAITATHGSSASNIVGQMVFQHDSPGSRIKWGRLYHSGDMSTFPMQLISENSSGSAYLEMNTGSMRAPIFYDSNDTTYYLDPNAGTSLNIAGKITTAVSNGTIISHASMTDALGYNNSYGTYIGSVVGGTYYIYGNGTFYDNGTIRSFIHSGNIGSQSVSYASSTNLLNTLSNYVWSASTLPSGYNAGIQTSFVSASEGFPSYGSVLTNRTYTGSQGGTLQLYTPYGPAYGGTRLGFRSGIYETGAWSGWKYLLNDSTDPYAANMNQYVRSTDDVNFNTVGIPGANNTPINITGSAHKYLTINPGNGYEAMVRYIGGSGSSWYVGKRTSGQLIGTQSFHFYSEEAGATVGGINPSGDMIVIGSMRANIFYDQQDTGYYLDPNDTSNLYRFTESTLNRHSLNSRQVNSPWATRAAQGTLYQTGAMGWGQYDLNVIASNWGSGFFDTWSSPANGPGASGHYVGMQAFHYNNSDSAKFHGWQMACAQEAVNRWFWRSAWDVPRSWVEMIHSGNIGSQSVNNSAQLDGFGRSNFLGFNGNSYYQASSWIQLNGWHGLYAPSWNGAHWMPNNASTYTTWRIAGSRSGYSGIYDDYSAVNMLMFDSAGNGGAYRENNGRWYWYHHLGNNCTAIATSTTSSSYRAYIGGSLYAEGDVVAYSDVRKKTDIITIDNALEKVNKLRGVFYTRIDAPERGRQTGVIAQEINQVLPEVVTYAADVDEYGVSYGNIVGVLIEAIKEQQKQIEELQNKLDNVLSSR